LIAPPGEIIDSVQWGENTGVRARAGISLERVDWHTPPRGPMPMRRGLVHGEIGTALA
jgi:hypothetical protein